MQFVEMKTIKTSCVFRLAQRKTNANTKTNLLIPKPKEH